MANPTNPSTYRASSHALAVLVAAITLILILMGGLVTNTGSALAVPDWPTTFGHNMFLFPWERMVGGVFYEHTHRLLGSLVGMLTVLLAVVLWRSDGRRWLRYLGAGAVVVVIVQGVLGGMRVVLLENGLALVHGCFAQAFFALVVSLAVFASRFWHEAAGAARADASDKLQLLTRILVPAVYLQLVLGAVVTHTGNRLDAHLLFAALVMVGVILCATHVLTHHADQPPLRRPALALIALLGLQLSLGLGAYLWRFTGFSSEVPGEVGLAILAAHRLTGTCIWAAVIVLCLRAHRLFGQRSTARSAGSLPAREAWT